jgi:phosphopantothenoylcysteine decarboxylase / phosphopantothenate---cysteine ligase
MLMSNSSLQALVTAGPTYEELDPVRFIGNYSTGKMGFAIATSLADRGVNVKLIAGPTQQKINHPLIDRVDVISAEQMYQACLHFYPSSDLAVFAAAVADYRPMVRADQKLKKTEDNLTLVLEKTVDIARELGKRKTRQKLVGFALETEDEIENACKKMTSKNLDLIVLNSLNDEGAGFGCDTNKITIINRAKTLKQFALQTKADAARCIVDEILGAE